MAELADALDLGSSAPGRESSSLSFRTIMVLLTDCKADYKKLTVLTVKWQVIGLFPFGRLHLKG